MQVIQISKRPLWPRFFGDPGGMLEDWSYVLHELPQWQVINSLDRKFVIHLKR